MVGHRGREKRNSRGNDDPGGGKSKNAKFGWSQRKNRHPKNSPSENDDIDIIEKAE